MSWPAVPPPQQAQPGAGAVPAGLAAGSLTGSAVLDEVLRWLVVVRGPAAPPPGAALPLRPPGTSDPDPAGAAPADTEIVRVGTATAEVRVAGHELVPPVTYWLSRHVIGVG